MNHTRQIAFWLAGMFFGGLLGMISLEMFPLPAWAAIPISVGSIIVYYGMNALLDRLAG